MTTLAPDHTVLPPAKALDELVALLHQPHSGNRTMLVGPDGAQISLPREVVLALRTVVDALAAGNAVTVTPVHQRLTTQEAADLLGISRPTFVKLLESGAIPFERLASHRRVRLADLLAYRHEQAAQRRAALDRMVDIAASSGMYEKTERPVRTR